MLRLKKRSSVLNILIKHNPINMEPNLNPPA